MFRATLSSVLRQTYQNFEIIISDNASQEDLEAEIVAANDARIRYIRQENNIGPAANFAFLQKLPIGEYVLFLCSDDLLLSNCLSAAVAALDAQPQRGGAVYMAAHYSEDGFQYLSRMPDADFAAADEYAADHAIRDFRFTSPSLCLYRRSIFERLGGWNTALLAVGDWELFSRMIRLGGGVIFLHEPLAIMRLHDNRDSNTGALHWGFYHDTMLLSAQPEYKWGPAVQAHTLMHQLLWDFRLKRSPMRTLCHAWRVHALWGGLLFLPWEILRRMALRVRTLFSAGVASPSPDGAASVRFDRDAADRFWRESERVRNAYASNA